MQKLKWIVFFLQLFKISICAICEFMWYAMIEKITGKKHYKKDVFIPHSKESKNE